MLSFSFLSTFELKSRRTSTWNAYEENQNQKTVNLLFSTRMTIPKI